MPIYTNFQNIRRESLMLNTEKRKFIFKKKITKCDETYPVLQKHLNG